MLLTTKAYWTRINQFLMAGIMVLWKGNLIYLFEKEIL